MHIKLSENIRVFRKARSLTQEQLAEALGVTVGAVYKWEAGLSTPDITLIVGLADLFDTSVDVLLGYELRNNKQNETVERLKKYLHNKDRSGLTEADKALVRYPNSFEIVHQSAMLYYMFGLLSRDKALLRRSIDLMERSTLLLGQNTNPKISDLSICIDLAGAYSCAGDDEKALQILKKNNPCGINDASIGLSLAGACNRPEEAVGYLSAALVSILESFVRVVAGYVNVFFKKEDFSSGESILRMALTQLDGWKKEGKSSFLDKSCVFFSVCLAFALMKQGDVDEARRSLRTAKDLAERFDRSPNYAINSVRFVSADEQRMAFDDLGETAMACIRNTVKGIENESFSVLWEETGHAE